MEQNNFSIFASLTWIFEPFNLQNVTLQLRGHSGTFWSLCEVNWTILGD